MDVPGGIPFVLEEAPPVGAPVLTLFVESARFDIPAAALRRRGARYIVRRGAVPGLRKLVLDTVRQKLTLRTDPIERADPDPSLFVSFRVEARVAGGVYAFSGGTRPKGR